MALKTLEEGCGPRTTSSPEKLEEAVPWSFQKEPVPANTWISDAY